jgi:hypothetical protein
MTNNPAGTPDDAISITLHALPHSALCINRLSMTQARMPSSSDMPGNRSRCRKEMMPSILSILSVNRGRSRINATRQRGVADCRTMKLKAARPLFAIRPRLHVDETPRTTHVYTQPRAPTKRESIFSAASTAVTLLLVVS